MKEHLIEVLTDVPLIVLPINLIFLYFISAWHEPNQLILASELVCLFGFPVFGIWRLWRYLSRLGRIWRSQEATSYIGNLRRVKGEAKK